MKQSCAVCKIVCLLLIIGALNWGLIGLFDLNLIAQLLGGFPIAERIIYILVGVAGVIKLISCFKKCPCCKKETPA